MGQPYRATDYSDVDVESRDGTTSEDTSLLGVASARGESAGREGHATIASSIGNLLNTVTIVASSGEYLSVMCGISRPF